MSENYREPEDLLSDPSFLSWYFTSGKEIDRTWENWTAGHPDRELLVKNAIILLEATRLPEKDPTPQQLQNAELALFRKIDIISDKPSVIGRRRCPVVGQMELC